MNQQTKHLLHLGTLRRQAHTRLHGQHASASPEATASAAMGVLHAMAASPDTAEQALAVLHELQVHQVEIDMQAEALQASLADADDALSRQLAYLDHLPVACLTLTPEGCLTEINQTALRWLGASREGVLGQQWADFLSPEDAAQLRHQLTQLRRDQGTGSSWPMTVLTREQPPRVVMASISDGPEPGRHILVLMAPPTPA